MRGHPPRRADRAPGRCRAGEELAWRRASPAAMLPTRLLNASQDALVPKEEEVADPAAVPAPLSKQPVHVREGIDAPHPGGAVPLMDAFDGPRLAVQGGPGFVRVLGQIGLVARAIARHGRHDAELHTALV